MARSARAEIKSVVRGTFGAAGRVTGSFEPSRFVVKNGKVFGVGMLFAKLTRADGSVLGRFTARWRSPSVAALGHWSLQDV